MKAAKVSCLVNDIDLDLEKRVLDISRYYEDARELAKRLTKWSKGLKKRRKIFVVCTGVGLVSWKRPTGAHRNLRA